LFLFRRYKNTSLTVPVIRLSGALSPPQNYDGSSSGEDGSNPSTTVRDALLRFFKTFRHLWHFVGQHSVQLSTMSANENSKQELRGAHGPHIGIPRGATLNARATLRYAFVESSSNPPTGAWVKMSIQLPATLNTEKSLRMEAQGRVVRVEPGCEPRGPTLSGFAVSTEQVSLCPS
jgi:hypothetical protein